VIDASHPGWEEQVDVVESVLRELSGGAKNGDAGNVTPERKRVVYVFNKADLLPDPGAFLARVAERYPHAVLTSTLPATRLPLPDGVAGLRDVLRASAQALRPVARVRVPISDGKLLAELHREGEVMGQEQHDGVVVVTARVEAQVLGRLRQAGIAVEIFG
jgi:GTP-binding protein HflX